MPWVGLSGVKAQHINAQVCKAGDRHLETLPTKNTGKKARSLQTGLAQSLLRLREGKEGATNAAPCDHFAMATQTTKATETTPAAGAHMPREHHRPERSLRGQ